MFTKFPTSFQATALCLAISAAFSPYALANPLAPTVTAGSASFSTSGNTLTVTNSPSTIINWQQFNIAAHETTRFVQQSAQSAVLNRIGGGNASQIMGTLQSNGKVFLLNPHGILFGAGSSIDVNGLVASSLNMSDANFLTNKLLFTGGGLGAVSNLGNITTPQGGTVYLLGSEVNNQGIITSPGGQVVLAAGSSVSLVESSGPELSVTLTADTQQARNLGTITAQGGKIDMYGALVEQAGVLKADSAMLDASGRVVLKATQTTRVSGSISATHSAGKGGEVKVLGDAVVLTDSAVIDASGTSGGGTVLVGGNQQGMGPEVNSRSVTLAADAHIKADALTQGKGGRVILYASDAAALYGNISAQGAGGGAGGFVETSGKRALEVKHMPTVGAGGEWLIDPNNIEIGATGTDTTTNISGSITTTGDSAFINASTIVTSLNAGANVTITTGSGGSNTQVGDITVSSAITKTNFASGSLTLIAHNSIYINAPITATDSAFPLSLTLRSDSDNSNAGAIYISDNISLKSGQLTAINGNSSAPGNVFITNGTVTLNNATTFNQLTLSGGTLAGTGDVTVAGAFNWTGGNLGAAGASNGTFTTTGTVSMSPSADTLNMYRDWNLNSGGTFTAAHSGNDGLYIGNKLVGVDIVGSTLTVASMQTLTLIDSVGGFTGGTIASQSSNTGNLVNNGTVAFSGNRYRLVGSLGILNVTNNGSITVPASFTLETSASTFTNASAGNIQVLTGAILNISSGTFNENGGTFGMVGTLKINGGTLNLNNPSAITISGGVTLSTGTLAGTGNVTLAGAFNWTGGTLGSLSTSGLFTTTGSVTMNPQSSDSLTLYRNWNFNSSGTFTADGPNSSRLLLHSSTLTIDSGKTLTLNDITTGADIEGVKVSKDSTFSGSIVNNGTLQVSIGNSYMDGVTLTNNGSLSVASGGKLDITGVPAAMNLGAFSAAGGTIAITSTAGAINLGAGSSGALSASTSGDISQSGAINVTGTTSLTAGSGSITVDNTSNSFTGAVSLSNSGANNVALRSMGALNLGTVAVGSGTLVLTAGGAITQSGSITQEASAGSVQVSTGLAPITLDNTANNFTGAVSLSNTGTYATKITDMDALTLGNLTLGGDTTLNNLILGSDLTVVSHGALHLGSGVVTGNLIATSNSGAITQSGANILYISGTSVINSGAGAITLATAGNNFGGLVTLNSSGTNAVEITDGSAFALGTVNVGGNLIIHSSGGLDLGSGTVGIDLRVTSGNGSITQSGALSIAGNTTIDAGTGEITLTNAGNDFVKSVLLVSTGSFPIALTDANALALDPAIVIGSGGLTVNSSGPLNLGGGNVSGALTANSGNGAVTQSGSLAVAGNTDITAGSGSITLSVGSNAFTSFSSPSSSALLVSNASALSLGNISSAGPISISTNTTDLTLSGNISTSSTGINALTLNAGLSSNYADPAGGNILVVGTPTITLGSGGTARLYTGSISGSTGLTNLVGLGSGRFRYNSDETTTKFTKALGIGVNAIYREQPTGTSVITNQSTTYGELLPFAITATGTVNGDVAVALISNPTYSSAGIIKVSASPYTLISNLAGLGYLLTTDTPGQLTVNRSALSITSIVANTGINASKTYDGTTAATLSATPAVTPLGSDAVSLVSSGLTASFADKNAGYNKVVTITGLSLTGADAGNYTLLNTITSDIQAKYISLTGLTAANKTYDATATAVLSGTAAVNSGGSSTGDEKVYAGDNVSVIGTKTGGFTNKDVGTNKMIFVSGLSLGGADATNYYLTSYTLTANITAKSLNISGLTPTSKVYDSTALATLTGSAVLSSGASSALDGRYYGTEDVGLLGSASASFANKNAGTSKAVTITGLSLTGTDAANYTLASYSSSADITAKTLNLSGLTASNKTYDSTTTATLTGTALLANGASTAADGKYYSSDTVSLQGSTIGSFASKNVGTGKSVSLSGMSLSGTDAANYTLASYSSSADITVKTLNLSGLTASNKTYDSTTTATLTGTALLANGASTAADGKYYSSDTFSLQGSPIGAFANANVGTAKAVTITGLSLAGTDATNYTLAQPGLSANISQAATTTDPCIVNPASCTTTTTSTTNTTTNSTTSGTPAANASVTFDAATAAAPTTAPAVVATVAAAQQLSSTELKTEATLDVAASAKLSADAKQADADAQRTEVKSKQLEADATKAEQALNAAEAKAGGGGESPALDATRLDVAAKKSEAEGARIEASAKKIEAEGKRAESDAKLAEAESKLAVVEAREAKTPEQKKAAENKAEEKSIESVIKTAEAQVKKERAELKKDEAEAKQAEADASSTSSRAKKLEGESKTTEAAELKTEANQKLEVAEQKAAEVKQKAAEVEKKTNEAFRKVAASVGATELAMNRAMRNELKTEIFSSALNVLDKNPQIANLPTCGAGVSDVCIPKLITNLPAMAAQAAKSGAIAAPEVTIASQASALASRGLPVPKVTFLPQVERKIALLVGINNYKDPAIPALESAVADVEAIGKLMGEQLGYEVRVIKDATRADIVKSMNALAKDVGANDSVTVYFAGHGYVTEKDKVKNGYWIPSDATVKDPSQWVSNNDIGQLLSNIPAKQTMLISDSCYSGNLVGSEKVTAQASINPAEILSKRTVTVMSSGGDEPVSDEGKDGHSIFAWSLMESMKKVGEVSAGANLFDTVRTSVTKDYPQLPQYGSSTSAGHTKGGDYLLEVRKF